MINSKTYNIVGNYIQASELAYTTIYVVKKDGVQHDLYNTDANRSYIYDSPNGKIIFPTEGEKAFVIYKETSPVVGPIPGVCEPVAIVSTTMPVGVVGTLYEYTVLLTGSQPRTLSNIVKPSWVEVFPYSLSGVKVSGTPDTETTESVSFDVSNGCGTDSFSQSFNVISGTVNFFVGGRFFTSRINSITGPDYILTSGSLPAVGPTAIEGVHDAYTGTITVIVQGIVFPLTLRLEVNGVLLEAIPVPSDDTYVFASQSYLTTDEISIILTT